MYSRYDVTGLDAMLTLLGRRTDAGVYFVRLCGCSADVERFLCGYFDKARSDGAYIEGRLPNPDGNQLEYFNNILGGDFRPDADFIAAALSRWMPRMPQTARTEFSNALAAELSAMQAQGKSPAMLKNLYVKVMCWLYYRLERAVSNIGAPATPCILYEGSDITAHELTALRILNGAGIDILMVETKGDAAYLKLDPDSKWSQLYAPHGLQPFPTDFSIAGLRAKSMQRAPAQPTPAQRPTSQPRHQSDPQQGAAPSQSEWAVPINRRAQQPAQPVPTQNTPQRRQTAPIQHVQPQRPAQSVSTQNTQAAKPTQTVPNNTYAPAAPQSAPTQRHIQTTPPPQPQRMPAVPVQPRAQSRAAIDLGRYFPTPARVMCANAWLKEPAYNQVLLPPNGRGDDPRFFYNAFIRVRGVQDKLTYVNELYQFGQQLKRMSRPVVIVDSPIPAPEPEEVSAVRRREYRSAGEMIVDIATNLPVNVGDGLQKLCAYAFYQAMAAELETETNLRTLTTTAVYLICWLRRYMQPLFKGWKESAPPCFILMGGCGDGHEAAFMRLLAGLPVDVLIFAPDLNRDCALRDERLLDLNYAESLSVASFPKDNYNMNVRTVASHAEEELTTMLYSDSGLYRNRQFNSAVALPMDCTYDEIFILWKQELKFRQGFSTEGGTVSMPVIYAKVEGVEQGRTLPYWQKVKALLSDDTFLIKDFPFVDPRYAGEYQSLSVDALRHGTLQRTALRQDRRYPFGILREEVQEHMLDKLQAMLDRRIIRGTAQNGAEYRIISTILSMPRDLVRMIQNFDFTRRNPKLVCINTREHTASLEDAILICYLQLIGFDVVMFAPTGYQLIEPYLEENLPKAYQIGGYIYDMDVPDFSTIQTDRLSSLLGSINNLWKRG